MKNFQKIMLAAGIVLALSVVVNGQNTAKTGDSTGDRTPAAQPGKFTDNNNNGVCDNFELRNQKGNGHGFVDKNGDGICDNRNISGRGRGQSGQCGQGQGFRHRHGNGKRNCNGKGFCGGRGQGF